MNFLYVENFLTNCLGHSPEFIVDQIKKLITEVKEQGIIEPIKTPEDKEDLTN